MNQFVDFTDRRESEDEGTAILVTSPLRGHLIVVSRFAYVISRGIWIRRMFDAKWPTAFVHELLFGDKLLEIIRGNESAQRYAHRL